MIISKFVSVSIVKLFGVFVKYVVLMINIVNGKRFNIKDKDLKKCYENR